MWPLPPGVMFALAGAWLVVQVADLVHVRVVVPRGLKASARAHAHLREARTATNEAGALAAFDQASAHIADNERRVRRAEHVQRRVFLPLHAIFGAVVITNIVAVLVEAVA